MEAQGIVLVLVVVIALAFDFTNGFHDTANAMATSIATKALKPKVAVGLAALLNFVGAFISLKVAATIAEDIVDPEAITTTIILAGLLGGIFWNLLTWRLSMPSSSRGRGDGHLHRLPTHPTPRSQGEQAQLPLRTGRQRLARGARARNQRRPENDVYSFAGTLLLTGFFTTGVLFAEVDGQRAAVARRAAGALCFGLSLALAAFGIYVMFSTK